VEEDVEEERRDDIELGFSSASSSSSIDSERKNPPSLLTKQKIANRFARTYK